MEENKKISIKEKMNNTVTKIKKSLKEQSKKDKFINAWKDIMFETGSYTESFKSLTIIDLNIESYGFSANILAPKGTKLEILEELKPYIETGLKCIFLYTRKKASDTVKAQFISKGFGGKGLKFVPPKTTPFELFLGYSVDGTPVIISVRDVSHFLLSGSNGSGKSRMLDCIITTLIHNCDETELELYLAQISKNDLVIYEDAKCCRAFCETLDEVEIMLEHIIEKMHERDKLIKPMRKDFKGSNISDYNKLYPHKKLSVCWIIFDEVASVMNKTGNIEKVKKQKDRIISMMENIARVGRALGIFLGVCLQRPKAESLSPDVKAQANLKISFAQNNTKSSEVAMDDSQIAIGLDERVAVYSCRASGYDFVKTPYIDDKLIEKYVKSKSQRGHRNLFTDLKKLENNKLEKLNKTNINKIKEQSQQMGKGVITLPDIDKNAERNKNVITDDIKENKNQLNQIKETALTENEKTSKTINDFNKAYLVGLKFDNVDPNIITKKEQRLKENISNIPNFVPYNPVKNTNVIDQTKIDMSNTEKPKRKKGVVILNDEKGTLD